MADTDTQFREFGNNLRAFLEGFLGTERRSETEKIPSPESEPVRGMRFMTEKFRVHSLAENPLTQMPPQSNFITASPTKARIPLFNEQRQRVGVLFPLPANGVAEDTPVCLVTESHALSTVENNTHFPEPGLESFLCEVTYGVEINGFESKAVVRGPRLVKVSEAYVDPKDEIRTVDLEIVEMYLAGYDPHGSLITVKGGRNLDLPIITGQAKALAKDSDFPASLFFDLIVEVTHWGTAGY